MKLRQVGLAAALALTSLFGPFGSAAEAASSVHPSDVVVIAVPGLLWSDVEAMPVLRQLASVSAVGELTVKTAGATTRCAAGVLAVSAGNRTQSATPGCVLPPGSWAALTEQNRSSRYRTQLGQLGTALQRNGIQTIAVNADAIPLLAARNGTVSAVVGGSIPAIPDGQRVAIATLIPDLYSASGRQRSGARAVVDHQINQDLHEIAPGSTIIVAGISDASSGHADLHPLIVSGRGWTHHELRGSTGRTPYTQLIDLTPTVLAAFGLPSVPGVVGQAVQPTASGVPAISAYVEQNQHAVGQRTLGQRTFLALGLATILLMLLAWWGASLARAAATWLARMLAPAPAMAFVGNAFPWWRWGQLSYLGIVLALCVAVAVLTTAVARHRRRVAALIAPAVSLVILALDQLAGSRLQFSAPLGDNPLVAGRFHGVGNLDFAVIATSAVVLACLLGTRLDRARGAPTAVAIMLLAVVVDGTPRFGDDLGGVLALVPALLVVLAGVLGIRATWRRAVGVAVTSVVVAIGIALADYSRPPSRQTHVGRFVGQVLHGGAGAEVHRKFDSMIGSFGLTIGTFVAVIALILAVLNRRRLSAAIGRTAGLGVLSVATLVVAVLGSVLNDSGVTIAAMVTIVGFASVYSSGWYLDAA